MIEKDVFDYLSSTLSVDVYMEEPEVKPDSYVVIQKTGSSMEDYIEHATLAIQGYALSMYDAALLNESVKQRMLFEAPDVINMTVKLNSDYNFTDTTTKRYRYQAVFDIIN